MPVSDYVQSLCGKHNIQNADSLYLLLTSNENELNNLLNEISAQNSWVYLTKQTYDGCYCIPQGSKWIVYQQERGRIDYGPEIFNDKASALVKLLQLSGYFWLTSR